MAKIGHHAKPITFQNRHFGSKITIVKNMRKTTLEPHSNFWVQKNFSKKTLIFEKWTHFQKGQNWPPCKGYSLSKIVTLAQKLKLSKAYAKQLYKHIWVVVCKKPLQETSNSQKMKHFQKGQNWPPWKGYSLCKIVTLAQKLKLPKTSVKQL